MQTRKERRKAEKVRKRKVSKFGGSGGPVNQFFNKALDYIAQFGGEYVGCDKNRKYVGETGPITPAWQKSHETCNHGFETGHWWLKVGDQEYVSFPNQDDAKQALFDAGAAKIGGQVEFGGSEDDVDDFADDEIDVADGDEPTIH